MLRSASRTASCSSRRVSQHSLHIWSPVSLVHSSQRTTSLCLECLLKSELYPTVFKRSKSSYSRQYSAAAVAVESLSSEDSLSSKCYKHIRFEPVKPLSTEPHSPFKIIFPSPANDEDTMNLWLNRASTESEVTSTGQILEMSPLAQPQESMPSPYLPLVVESISFITACLKLGEIKRAVKILTTLDKRLKGNKILLREMGVDARVHNAFLEALSLYKPKRIGNISQWFDDMRSLWKVSPDATSYAYLLKVCLSLPNPDSKKFAIRGYTKECERDGISLQDVLNTNILLQDEIQELLNIISSATPIENKSNVIEDSIKDLKIFKKSFDELPQPMPVRTKGVQYLRTSLTPLYEAVDKDALARQYALEDSVYESALEKFHAEKESYIKRGVEIRAMNVNTIRGSIWDWHQKLTEAIDIEIKKIIKEFDPPIKRKSKDVQTSEDQPNSEGQAKKPRDPIKYPLPYEPFLRQLSAKKLALITILQVLRLQGTGGIPHGMKYTRAVINVGRAVEDEIAAEEYKRRQKKGEFPSKWDRNMDLNALFSSGKLFNMTIRRKQAELEKGTNDWLPSWTQNIRAAVGGVLISKLVDTATFQLDNKDRSTGEMTQYTVPAFSHTYQLDGFQKLGVIKIHPRIVEKLMQEPIKEALHPDLLPMLVLPRPWLSHNSGGYLCSSLSVLRIKDSQEQGVYLRAASDQNLLDTVLAGMDVLGSTPWRINERVLGIVLEVWNSGRQVADIPELMTEDHLILPPKPEAADFDQAVKSTWLEECKQKQTDFKNNHCLRCDTNYKIEIARAFLGEKMYFPHNMDFRGRAYPMAPHLNHLGNDLCRGLLEFYDGKPLGQSGLMWLKVQIANLYGYDKASFSDREAWVMNHLDEVFDSAERPLEGKRWWEGADDPWQCLACCFELTQAIKSGDPYSYISHVPIHQDGTCNGLQHYAALGGDMEGAKQVNLEPSEKPQDVYSGVLQLVAERVAKDAEKGDEKAIAIKGILSRKIIKQTVMTTVYGVTYIGARAQISKQLKTLDKFTPRDMYKLSAYLTHLVFKSIGQIFHGARAIQDWLTATAGIIAKSLPEDRLQINPQGIRNVVLGGSKKLADLQMTSVVWTTPLNLPIVQPYRKLKQKQVKTHLQTIYISDPNAPAPVDPRKQKTAFPPNFIHSLDATHMIMTALECNKQGLTFAAVHDSYWTHACDIDQMASIIREQFIELHSLPIMENLKKEFEERYSGYYMAYVNKDVPLGSNGRKSKRKTKQQESAEEQENSTTKMQAENDQEIKVQNTSIIDGDGDDNVFEDEVDEVPSDVIETPKRVPRVNWVPLQIPDLPPKGEFDVRNIKQSKYFFH